MDYKFLPTIYDLGYNLFLSKPLLFDETSLDNPSWLNNPITGGVNPNSILSGQVIGNLVMADGFMCSGNFVSGSAGWIINSDGTAQFNSITLTGGTINYGKTSFVDSTNAGYWIGSSGLYFGKAADASYVKYDIGANTFTIAGITFNWSDVGGAGKPADNATVGATFNVNVSGGGTANSQVSNTGYTTRYLNNLFGDGNNGDVVISANTTLTSDMYYNNLTVNSGYTLDTGGYRVFVKGTLTTIGTGFIGRVGNAGGNGANGGTTGTPLGGTAGAVLSTGTIYGGLPGEIGGNGGAGGGGGSRPGQPGVIGDNQTESYAANGVAGGIGGNGNGGSGGAAGGAGTATQTTQPIRNVSFATIMREFSIANTVKYITSSAGSGSGGGGGTSVGGTRSGGAGGGSGSSGGIAVICARVIVNAGTISCKGGAGGKGGDGGFSAGEGGCWGNGGGGGGGSGGILVLIYNSLTNTGTITAGGGAKGLAGTPPVPQNPYPLPDPLAADGTDGLTGNLIQLEV